MPGEGGGTVAEIPEALASRSFEHVDAYVYDELDLDAGDIRILKLLRGSGNQPINCEIASYASTDRPVYRALSYAWGAPGNEFPIILNGKAFKTRPNLYNFLKQKRYPDKDLSLWIDAVCINQNDVAERNYMVSIMDRIFSEAELVYAWIGEDDMEARAAFEFLNRAFSLLPQSDEDKPREFTDQLLRDGTEEANWDAVLQLCQRPYCYRLWVIQEVILAKSVLVCCGALEMDLDRLHDFGEGLRSAIRNCHDENIKYPTSASAIIQTAPASLIEVRRSWEQRQGSLPLTLNSFFARFPDALCEDPRDAVFGYLGVVRDLKQYRQQLVDYNLDPLGVLFKVLPYLDGQPSTVSALAKALRIDLRTIFSYSQPPEAPSADADLITHFLGVSRHITLPRLWYYAREILELGTQPQPSRWAPRSAARPDYMTPEPRPFNLALDLAHICNAWQLPFPTTDTCAFLTYDASTDPESGAAMINGLACSDILPGDLLVDTGRTIQLVVREDANGQCKVVGTAILGDYPQPRHISEAEEAARSNNTLPDHLSGPVLLTSSTWSFSTELEIIADPMSLLAVAHLASFERDLFGTPIGNARSSIFTSFNRMGMQFRPIEVSVPEGDASLQEGGGNARPGEGAGAASDSGNDISSLTAGVDLGV